MATVISFFLADGKNQFAVFEMQGSADNPFAIYELEDIRGVRFSKTCRLDPKLLQKLPPDSKMKADYFYQGQIVFPKPEEN